MPAQEEQHHVQAMDLCEDMLVLKSQEDSQFLRRLRALTVPALLAFRRHAFWAALHRLRCKASSQTACIKRSPDLQHEQKTA